MFSTAEPLGSENDEAPPERGFSQCAEEDSNLHPVSPDQALNLARLPIPPSARGNGEYSLGSDAGLSPSAAKGTVCEHTFDELGRPAAWR